MTSKERLQKNNLGLAECLELSANLPEISGSCDKPHVIEVDGLPTENIDDDATYKVSERTLTDIVMSDGETTQAIGSLINSGLFPGSLNVAPTKSTDGILISDENVIHLYYIEDENDVFIYGDLMGEGTNEWVPIGMMFSGETEMPYNGEISSTAEATEIGYYTIFCSKQYYAEHNKSFKTMLAMSGMWVDMSTYVGLSGGNLTYTDVGILPTKINEGVLESDPEGAAYGYYIEDEDNIFAYLGGEWVNVPEYIGLPYIGLVSGPAEVTDEGIYALVTDWDEYVHASGMQMINENGLYDVTDKANVLVDVDIPDGYIYPNGELSVTSNGVHDVKYYETVNVSVASNYMVQTVAELPTDVPDGAFAIVLGGA